nr:uncharacterized protein LOC104101767 [Ipomoea batatas]
MARITPTDLTLHKLSLLPFSPTVFITILAILAVLSTVVFLCGAHRALTSTRGNNVEQKKKNSVRLGGKKPVRLHITLLAGPWRSCDERLQTSSVSALSHLEETWAIPPESKPFWASVLAPPPMASLLPQTSSLFLSPTTHAQVILAVLPIELVVRCPDLLLHSQVLVPHVLDLDRDVAPGPLEGEENRVLEVVHRVHVVRDRLELLLPRLQLQQSSTI